MSVNGQDPRSNVYLLDGTLLNDFTNGPAGSAAGTALGMETVREFRVETNAYSAEFGRNSGGQINVADQVRHATSCSGSAYEFHRNDALDARELLRRRRQAGLHAQPVRRHGRRTDRDATGVLLRRLRSAASRTSAARSPRSCPTTTRARGILPSRASVGVNPAVAPYLNEYPARQRRQRSATAWRSTTSRSISGSTSTSCRAASTTTPSRAPVLRALHLRRCRPAPADRLPAVPARRSCRATSSSPASTAQVLSPRTLNTLRLGFSRTRIGQNVEANTSQPLPPFVPGREFVGDIDIGGLQRFGTQSSANVRLVQNVFGFAGRPRAHARPPPAEGRRARRALPGQHGQPDLQPGHLHVRRTCAPSCATRRRSFIGLTPEAQFDRYWRFTLFGGYVAGRLPAHIRG